MKLNITKEWMQKHRNADEGHNVKAGFPPVICYRCALPILETGSGWQVDGKWHPVHIGCYHELAKEAQTNEG